MKANLVRACIIAVITLAAASHVCAQTKSVLLVPVIPSVRNAGSWADELYAMNQILGSALDRMDADSSFKMSLGSPSFYDILRRTAPGVFADIQKKVASGALEPLGGMWTDISPSTLDEESLVRSVIYGRNALHSGLGVEPVAFLLDAQAVYPPAMPQILAGAGYEACVTGASHSPGYYRWASPHGSFVDLLALTAPDSPRSISAWPS